LCTTPALNSAALNPNVVVPQVAPQQAAPYLSATNYSSEALNSWLGMQAFAQVARSIKGPIDHASFLAALRTAKVSSDGIIPNIGFSKPIGNAQLRMCSTPPACPLP
jgi:hypothetical protein